MGVLYGNYDLLDSLRAYKVRPAPKDPPGKFEGMDGVLGALKLIEWVGKPVERKMSRLGLDASGPSLCSG